MEGLAEALLRKARQILVGVDVAKTLNFDKLDAVALSDAGVKAAWSRRAGVREHRRDGECVIKLGPCEYYGNPRSGRLMVSIMWSPSTSLHQ